MTTILTGDALKKLRTLPDGSVQMCVTSPPYWGLRDYGVTGQIGLEDTPEAYTAKLVEVFREVRRVLKDDGTLWLNLGDCYATGAGKACIPGGGQQGENWQGPKGYRGAHDPSPKHRGSAQVPDTKNPAAGIPTFQPNRMPQAGLKPKDLVGIPWRVAFALQADGWYLRSDIIWHKTNPMPESVTDRPTKAHEYLFLLSKSQRYYYDAKAVKEPCVNGEYFHGGYDKPGLLGAPRTNGRTRSGNKAKSWGLNEVSIRRNGLGVVESQRGIPWEDTGKGRNKRSVWTISTKPFKGAHFATFPPKLIEPCILAGSRPGDVVLDPFFGAGTVGLVAQQHGRDCISMELNPAYVKMARERLAPAARKAAA